MNPKTYGSCILLYILTLCNGPCEELASEKNELPFKIQTIYQLEHISASDAIRYLDEKFSEHNYRFIHIESSKNETVSWGVENLAGNAEILKFISSIDILGGFRGTTIFFRLNSYEAKKAIDLIKGSRELWSDEFVLIADSENNRIFMMGNQEEAIHVQKIITELNTE